MIIVEIQCSSVTSAYGQPEQGSRLTIAETTAAVDALATGNVVFATLVDDPASVGDLVDAYLGEIMLEVATASESADAGLVYAAAIDEAAIAISAEDGAVPSIYTDSVVEAASAVDAPNASTAAGTAVTTTSVGGPLFMFEHDIPEHVAYCD